MAEWPPNTTRFPMDAESGFFLCTHCRNHLAPLNDCVGHITWSCEKNFKAYIEPKFQIAWPGTAPGYLCRIVVNVRPDHFSTRWFRYHLPVVYIRCKGCNRAIGEKIHVCDPPTNDVYEGNYVLHSDHVLYWDGHDLRDAASHEPVYDNSSP
ncbi:hypothetical protein V6N13_058726 [Hibiscus sabdariffa]